jgi:GNAT superfamily N-acetyltransferase
MSLRVGFDVDGVIADFRAAFAAIAGRTLDRSVEPLRDPEQSVDGLSARDIHRVWKTITATANWWTTLVPYEPHQIERLYMLSRTLGWEVFFLTTRPATEGDTVQFQTQWWLEQYGFYLPSVITIPGGRGVLATALRLDLFVDDLLVNCVDVVGASTTKAVLLAREATAAAVEADARARGIGVVHTIEQAIDVAIRLGEMLPATRGARTPLASWFRFTRKKKAAGERLPANPRETRPIPPKPE